MNPKLPRRMPPMLLCCASALFGTVISLATIALGADDVATAPGDAPRQEKEKVVALADLEITLPATWSVVPQNDTLLTARSPAEDAADRFLENLRLKSYPMKSPRSVDDILEVQLASIESEFKLKGSGQFKNGRTKLLWMAISPKSAATPQDDSTKLDVLAVNGKTLYVMHFMSPSAEFEKHLPRFQKIAETLKFTNPVPDVVPAGDPPRQKSAAYEQGRRVGQYTGYALVLAVIGWGLFALIRRVATPK